jgi:hypothetical protein
MSAQPSYTERQARDDCQSYQRFAGIVSRLINRDLNRLDDATAKKYFKPSLFQTVHSLHGFFNGRDLKKKDLIVSHQFVAPFFDYKGDPENSGTFMGRRLDGLADAEFASGHLYFEIERADNVTLLFTHYKSHPLLDAARWVYFQARQKPDYWKNPAIAITDELLDAALERLPKIDEKEISEWERCIRAREDKPDMEAGDMMMDAVLKGRWTKWKNQYREILEDETTKGGKNPLIVFEQIKRDLEQTARELYEVRCRQVEKQCSQTDYDFGQDDAQDNGCDVNGYRSVPHSEPLEASEQVDAEEATPHKNVGGTEYQVVGTAGLSETPKTENDFSMLGWALQWAALGIPVFPLHEVFDGICTCSCTPKKCSGGNHGCGSECSSKGKHPRTKKGVDEATTDAEQIRAWWDQWPMANIGGAMGGPRRLLAVDVDPRNGGDASLHDLVETHGDGWLDTRQHKTGSGGYHFFYTVPEGVNFSKGKLAPGIDLKWSGGYVVLPLSLHASGLNYSIDNQANEAPAPEWMLEELTRRPDAQPAKVIDFQERRAASGYFGARIFHEGERDNGLRDVAYGRWINGWAESEADLTEQLLEVNAARCVPPLDYAVVVEKAQRTARKFSRGEQRQQGRGV